MLGKAFDVPKNYSELLNKTGLFGLAILLITITTFERSTGYPKLFFEERNLYFEVKLPLADYSLDTGLFCALAIALTFRIFKLHNILSNAFGIRRSFDKHHILKPMLSECGLVAEGKNLDKFTHARKAVLQETFYTYASFTKPRIPEQLVMNALEAWQWHWMALEAFFTFACSLVMTAIFFPENVRLLLLWLSLMAACALIIHLKYKKAKENAPYQIKAIFADQGNLDHIKSVLKNALRD